MTTIAYRDGVLAADSCVSMEDEGSGDWHSQCVKLFRFPDMLVALQGESTPGMVFLDMLLERKGSARQRRLEERIVASGAAFEAVVLTRKGLFTYDHWCRPEIVTTPFYAVGSGVKAALGAMHAGADAVNAVDIACLIDPYSKPPVMSYRIDQLQRVYRK